VRSAAYYARGNTLFGLGRFLDARAAWVDSLRADPTQRDAKVNIELVDGLIGELAAQGLPVNQPGAASAPASAQPGGPAPSGSPGSGPSASAIPSASSPRPNASGEGAA